MNLFDYLRPASVEEAMIMARDPEAALLAGGTNLLDLMKLGVAMPRKLIDISRLPGLDSIETLPDGNLRIGAMMRNADMARAPEILTRYPAIAEALLSGASGQLRNAATLGGNLMQKTRCAYYQDPLAACNRRQPGSGCDALDGANRGHAVLGWTPTCIATHPSDLCVALAAFDAVVEIAGPDGRHELPLAEFHPLPGTEATESPLAAGEVVLAVRLPAAAAEFAGHARYLKLRERTSYAFALVSAAAGLKIEEGRITGARLALGAVAARPWRALKAEAALTGRAPDAAAFAEAAALALEGAQPSGDNAAKIELAKRIVVRALAQAAAGTPDRMPALPGSVFARAPEGASEGGITHG